MTREFAHPSSLTTQPEEKLKAQPIFAAKLLLRRKIGGAVGKGLEQQHTGAASLTPTGARPDPRSARFSCSIQPRSRRHRNRETHHQAPRCRLRGQHSFASSSRRDEQAPLPLKAVPERIMGFVSRAEAPRLILGCICT